MHLFFTPESMFQLKNKIFISGSTDSWRRYDDIRSGRHFVHWRPKTFRGSGFQIWPKPHFLQCNNHFKGTKSQKLMHFSFLLASHFHFQNRFPCFFLVVWAYQNYLQQAYIKLTPTVCVGICHTLKNSFLRWIWISNIYLLHSI